MPQRCFSSTEGRGWTPVQQEAGHSHEHSQLCPDPWLYVFAFKSRRRPRSVVSLLPLTPMQRGQGHLTSYGHKEGAGDTRTHEHLTLHRCLGLLSCVLPLVLIWPGRTCPELCFWHQQRQKPCCCPLCPPECPVQHPAKRCCVPPGSTGFTAEKSLARKT